MEIGAASFWDRLVRIVGPEHVSFDQTLRTVYSYDASLQECRPLGIVFPKDVQEVSAVAKEATRYGVPIVPRGFGTNLSGGTIPPADGLIVSLFRLKRILAIEPANRRAIVQPGVTNLELQNALAPLGYFYAPDPASQKVATMGGNVAENSGGPRCLKYGVTTNHILELEVVLPSGDKHRLGGPTGDGAGYDLRGLMIGSEGTLGIVTQLTVRILPKPEAVRTLLVIYDQIQAAAHSVSAIIAAGVVPAAMEMMDQPVMRAVEASFPCGYPLDAAAVLIIEVEGPAAGLEVQVQHIRRLCREHNCRDIREAVDQEQRDRLWAGRRGAFGAVSRLAPRYLVADCTVPRNKLPQALAQVAAICARYSLLNGNVFHAGDGNLHPLLLFDPRTPGQLDLVHRAGEEIMEACVALGGTITGEHGVGLEKKAAMRLVFSEDSLAFMQALKPVFDPLCLLNPGKILPDHIHPASPPEPVGPFIAPGDELIPNSESEAAQAIRRAFLVGLPIRPTGSGCQQTFGNLASISAKSDNDHPGFLILKTTGLNQITEHEPATQVVTSGAGLTLAALQAALAPHNQWLPLRPPFCTSRTLGGIVALNAWGPDRLKYGAPRDLLLGLRFVSGQGRIINAGGQVVKNVAGYDLTRLMTGSAGSLGLLTSLTFRVVQVPEICRMLAMVGTEKQLVQVAAKIMASSADPAFVYAVVRAAADSRDLNWELFMGFEGLTDVVHAQVAQARNLVRPILGQEPLVQEYNHWPGPWTDILTSMYTSPYVMRMDLPLEKVMSVTAAVMAFNGWNLLMVDLGMGRLNTGLSTLAGQIWADMSRMISDWGGYAALEQAPDDFKSHHDIFFPDRPDWALSQQLKEAVDPKNIFSPGYGPGRR